MTADMTDRQVIDDIEKFARTAIEAAKSIMRLTYHINCEIKYRQVLKNNGTRMDGLSFEKPGTNVHPTVYVNEAYERYLEHPEDYDNIIQDLVRTGYRSMEQAISMPEFTIEEARKCVSLDLVNYEKNIDMLEKQGIPFFTIGEDGPGQLAAFSRWHLSDQASFKVDESVCSRVQVTPDEMLTLAQKNTETMDYKLDSIGSVLQQMLGDMEEMTEEYDQIMDFDKTPQMLVLTSLDGSHGACQMLNSKAMEEAKEILQCEQVFVIPSSIHECLIVPDNGSISPSDLKDMIEDVNMTLAPEDVLSNVPLKFDTKLSLAIEPPEMKLAHEAVRTIKNTMDKTMDNALDSGKERKISMSMA